MKDESRPEHTASPEEIERRRAWVAKKQSDPEFMAQMRAAADELKDGRGVPWEQVNAKWQRKRRANRKRA